jgi:peptidoglycan/LPS O-acetylase OafA/YrhL
VLPKRKKTFGSVWIPSTPLPHMVQLDALRAFAVLAVLVSHFSPLTSKFYTFTRLIELGGLGVRLFFVLSGFLITGILLRSKSYCEKDGLSVLHAFRQFYARRVLRIFPLFYLVLGLAAVLNIPPVRQTFAWHAAFLTNFYIVLHGFNHLTSHFWSLAVEEQFYLAWPWVILLVSRRRLYAAILVTIAVGPVFRLFFGLGTGSYATSMFPLSCLDTLGVGALLALRKDQLAGPQSREYPFGKAGLLLGFAALGAFILLGALHQGRMIGYAIFDVGAALLAGWVVLRASIGFRGPIGKLLEIKPLIYLGTISYGIYVYHNFIPYVMYKTLGLPSIANVLRLPDAWPLDSLLKAGITVFVAALSWHFFERPINNLKRYFKYQGDRSPKRVPVSIEPSTVRPL